MYKVNNHFRFFFQVSSSIVESINVVHDFVKPTHRNSQESMPYIHIPKRPEHSININKISKKKKKTRVIFTTNMYINTFFCLFDIFEMVWF